MFEIYDIMVKIENSIFDYNIYEMNEFINQMVNELSMLLPRFSEQDLLVLNHILSVLQEAQSNKDFLMYADILHFELKPFIGKVMQEVQQ